MAQILVIDDNADLLQMIRLLLTERGGHEVILSAEGADGLAKAAENPPDLAIIDVMMPGMTGYQVCRQLRNSPATADIPIIILTARGQDIDRQASMDAGADLYIAKPVTMTDLLEQVSNLLRDEGDAQSEGNHGTIAMLSLRGGVGVTTLAASVAASCLPSSREGVCLFDLCPSSGNAALHFGLRPDPNWSAFTRSGVIPDQLTISDHLLSHASGLRILAAPFVPVLGPGLTAQATSAILSTLQADNSVVVIDLPSALNDTTMAALDAADAIALMVTTDAASIQATVGTIQALRPFLGKTHIILNQVIPGRSAAPQALERVLRQPIRGAIPFDPAQAQAMSQGQPLVLNKPDSPLAQAVARVVPVFLGVIGG
jgi:CheY-like chemotaxis protein